MTKVLWIIARPPTNINLLEIEAACAAAMRAAKLDRRASALSLDKEIGDNRN